MADGVVATARCLRHASDPGMCAGTAPLGGCTPSLVWVRALLENHSTVRFTAGLSPIVSSTLAFPLCRPLIAPFSLSAPVQGSSCTDYCRGNRNSSSAPSLSLSRPTETPNHPYGPLPGPLLIIANSVSLHCTECHYSWLFRPLICPRWSRPRTSSLTSVQHLPPSLSLQHCHLAFRSLVAIVRALKRSSEL